MSSRKESANCKSRLGPVFDPTETQAVGETSEIVQKQDSMSLTRELFANVSKAVDHLQQRIDFMPADHSEVLSSVHDYTRSHSLGTTISTPQNDGDVQTMFVQYHHRALQLAEAEEIIKRVKQHGWNALRESFTSMFKSQCSLSMTFLLEMLEPLCGTPKSQNDTKLVPFAVWEELLSLLVTRVLQSSTPSSRAFTSSYTFSDDNKVNEEWMAVVRFALSHFTVQDQAAMASHLGATQSLFTLNRIITHLPAHGFDGPLLRRLRTCAVQRCVNGMEPRDDVETVVEWVVRDQHTELLTTLLPLLQASATLIALPAVRQELDQDTSMSVQLRAVMHARIDSLQQQTVVPTLSWCLPRDHLGPTDLRVTDFLASGAQSVKLVGGFGGANGARKWVKQHWSPSVRGIVVNGVVILTKNDSAHKAAVRRAAEYKKEILDLCKLLHPHANDSVDGAAHSRVVKKARIDGY